MSMGFFISAEEIMSGVKLNKLVDGIMAQAIDENAISATGHAYDRSHGIREYVAARVVAPFLDRSQVDIREYMDSITDTRHPLSPLHVDKDRLDNIINREIECAREQITSHQGLSGRW